MKDQATFTRLAIRGYEECADFADAPRDEDGIEEESEGWASETLERMAADVVAFVEAEWADVQELEPTQVGYDFWLTRNHHGAGFWDRGLGELGERLTRAANAYGEAYLYVGDDGLTYLG